MWKDLNNSWLISLICVFPLSCVVPEPILVLFTAISRKVVGKMCTRQPRKEIWDMSNTLFLTTVPVESTFVAFL